VSELVDRYLRPREGWLSLGLLFVMLLAVGWSVQKAAWLTGLEFLVPVAFYAVVLGALLGLTRWSVVFTVPISALAGTAIVLWTVGGEYFTELSQIGRMITMRTEVLDWFHIAVDGGTPPQRVPYAIVLGLVMWVTAFIAAYTIYRHHRVMDAILLVGATLIGNMSATYTDLFGYLVLFVLAALLLWLRASLITREEGWVRRRVTENPDVPTSIMRSGVLFIAGTITLAWILTTVAVASPLTGVWNNLDGVWNNVRDGLDGVFGGLNNGDARIRGAGFGTSFSVTGNWTASDDPVMTVTADRGYYMRAVTYDVYTGHGWRQSDAEDRRVAAGDVFFPGYTSERPVFQDAFDLVQVAVQIDGSIGNNLFTPGFPTQALAPMVVREAKDASILFGLEPASSISAGEGYFITAMVSDASEAELAAAGVDYPAEVTAHYLSTAGVSEQTRQLARQVVEGAGADTPYAQARALANFLQRDSTFEYRVSAPKPSDPDQDLVDFFLFGPDGQRRIGYCEYYASAMAVMARTLGLPARVAVGYAPGERIETGVYQVRAKNSHAWAEVYFPGYGWQIFESTKTIPSLVRQAGTDRPIPTGGPNASIPPRFIEGDPGALPSGAIPSFEPVEGGIRPGDEPLPPESRGGNALIIGLLLLVAVGVGIWRLRRSRRSWRLLGPGERQWQQLAVAAGRAGVARRPTETIYEYAGWLEEEIPSRSPEIHTVADGKVWQSYSGRGMTGEAISRIERAWKRLELPLLWLTIRRRLRSLLPGR